MENSGVAFPDPERTEKNIETFLSVNPAYGERLSLHRREMGLLFSYSQFLANYSTQFPGALFDALEHLAPPDPAQLHAELREALSHCSSLKEGMKAVRHFKKRRLLLLTLRDILKKADLQDALLELTMLADVIAHQSLLFVESQLQQRYGTPENNAVAIIGLGKLGAEELNYSSDIDIIFVYQDDGETSGIPTPQGTTMNRVSAFEYYTKLVEEYAQFLSANTEDGFAYRVDLRLRPQGQKGSLALPLKSYEEYYQSWGQLWEKAALLRARHVAGDESLAQEFLKMIKPLIFRKYLDLDTIEEIRKIKMQVEQLRPGTLSRDIKRGYGGIREIEFFIHIFQLIYGGREPSIREKNTLRALHKLLLKGFIGHEDFGILSDNYVFLRTLENRLQQLNDVQTHSLPAQERDIEIVGRKMGFPSGDIFLSELERRRQGVRSIYDSLLEVSEEEAIPEGPLSNVFWDMGTPLENLLIDELSKWNIKDMHKAVHCLMKIRSTMQTFQTIKGRRLLEAIVPLFVQEVLKGNNPDLGLLQLVDFSSILAAKESYLLAISQKKEFIPILAFVLSNSKYLSKILMGKHEYIELLVGGGITRKSLSRLQSELESMAAQQGEAVAIRVVRRLEEVRTGVLFLHKTIDVVGLMRNLSRVAEVILSMLTKNAPRLAVIGYGKLGGRELTFNSDLDIIFVTEQDPSMDEVRAAEGLLKTLMSYTKEGIAYRVDTRLRPQGSKGPLITSLEGLKNYYMHEAYPWELQALLKARPIMPWRCTRNTLHRAFHEMRKRVLIQRGREVLPSEVRKMREKIQRDLVKEGKGYDLKFGQGGLEDLEFAVQYLQLSHGHSRPELLIQSTLHAIRRFKNLRILDDNDVTTLQNTYLFYRVTETMLRLQDETALKEGSIALEGIADSLAMTKDEFFSSLDARRVWVAQFWKKIEQHHSS